MISNSAIWFLMIPKPPKVASTKPNPQLLVIITEFQRGALFADDEVEQWN